MEKQWARNDKRKCGDEGIYKDKDANRESYGKTVGFTGDLAVMHPDGYIKIQIDLRI